MSPPFRQVILYFITIDVNEKFFADADYRSIMFAEVNRKMFGSKEIDMLHGSLWDKIIWFAIPLGLTGVMNQMFNTADVAVLGKFVGKEAMAAVGNNISLIGLLVNLFMGLSLGANVIIAQNIGAQNFDRVRAAVRTAFVLSIATGFGIVIVGQAATDFVLDWMEVPSEVRDMAETYLRMYLLSMPAMSIYNFEAAIFRSRGDTSTPLIALAIASALNLVLNLIFVSTFDDGVFGVGLATVIADSISALILFVALIRAEGVIHLDVHVLSIDRDRLKEIVRIGMPAGIQGMVFSLSNLLIQAAINSLGADTMAASAAAFTIEVNVFCIMNAFAQSTTTFVEQNYGARNFERCKRVTWVSMGLSTIFMGVPAIFILTFAEELLGFFNGDPNVIALGKIRLWYIVAPEVINVLLEGLSGALRGYGISMAPAMIILSGVCGVRITWLFTVFVASPTYQTLMAVYAVSWFVTTALMCVAYRFYMRHLH